MPNTLDKPAIQFSLIGYSAFKTPSKSLNFALASNLVLIKLLKLTETCSPKINLHQRPQSYKNAVGLFFQNEIEKIKASIKNPPFPPACPW